MAQNETAINKLIGRTAGGEYYWLDRVFDDSGDFKGAVGSIFRPVPKGEAEDRTDPENPDTIDYFEELWKMAVEAGNTQKGLEDFVSSVLAIDGDESVFDLSYYDTGVVVAEKYNEEIKAQDEYATENELAEFSECVGGGRCFRRDMEFEEVYDQDALDLALSYEVD